METVKEDHGKEEAQGQIESIKEMMSDLAAAEESGNDEEIEEAREAIENNPLEISRRFEILLCTGGPAARITGKLNENKEPSTANLEYQNWFTPWTAYPLDSEDEDMLLKYCQMFFFDE